MKWILTPISVAATMARQTAPRALEFVGTSEAIARLSAGGLQVAPSEVVTVCNIVVFLLWQIAQDFGFMRWMDRNFVLSYNDRQRRLRPYTMLSSAFSHYGTEHIVGNLTALRAYGPTEAQILGWRGFAYFYVAAVYVSDYFDLWVFWPLCNKVESLWGPPRKRRWRKIDEPGGSLGASGAIMSVLTFSCLGFPK
jgi:membrane associated rhomboid family serine protease